MDWFALSTCGSFANPSASPTMAARGALLLTHGMLDTAPIVVDEGGLRRVLGLIGYHVY